MKRHLCRNYKRSGLQLLCRSEVSDRNLSHGTTSTEHDSGLCAWNHSISVYYRFFFGTCFLFNKLVWIGGFCKPLIHSHMSKCSWSIFCTNSYVHWQHKLIQTIKVWLSQSSAEQWVIMWVSASGSRVLRPQNWAFRSAYYFFNILLFFIIQIQKFSSLALLSISFLN